jgi:hypothetical protein
MAVKLSGKTTLVKLVQLAKAQWGIRLAIGQRIGASLPDLLS